MDSTDNNYIWTCISCVWQIPSGRYTTAFVSNSEKSHTKFTLILDAVENKIYQNTWETIFLIKVNLCFDRKT